MRLLTNLLEKVKVVNRFRANEKVPVTATEEEAGLWHYLVIDPKGIRPRAEPVYTKAAKNMESGVRRYKEGEIIEVGGRKRAGWTTWLHLRTGDGWIFDISPNDKKVRMQELEVSDGPWIYEVLADSVVVLPAPMPSLLGRAPRSGMSVLRAKEVLRVSQRVRLTNCIGSYLRLADRIGWVLDFMDGRRLLQPLAERGLADGVPDEGRARDMPMAGPSPTLGASSAWDAYASEKGEWEYYVLDPTGMTLRSEPTYDKMKKNGKRVPEGQIVTVTERLQGDGTTFLRIREPAGWGFDSQPGSSVAGQMMKIRMVEIQIESGTWYYRCCKESGQPANIRPSFKSPQKCYFAYRQLAMVAGRLALGGHIYLKLQDGGWVCDFDAAGKPCFEGPLNFTQISCMATVTGGDVYFRSQPVEEKQAMTKRMLVDGSLVSVSLLVTVDDIKWAKCCKPGTNMEGWLRQSALVLERSVAEKIRTGGSSMRIGDGKTAASAYAAEPAVYISRGGSFAR